MATGLYKFEINGHAILEGAPDKFNRAAPEASEAMFAARDAFKTELRKHGFVLVRTGCGSTRMKVPD